MFGFPLEDYFLILIGLSAIMLPILSLDITNDPNWEWRDLLITLFIIFLFIAYSLAGVFLILSAIVHAVQAF